MFDHSTAQSTSNPSLTGLTGISGSALRRRPGGIARRALRVAGQNWFWTLLGAVLPLCAAWVVERAGVGELVHWLGKFHPPLVHLPIAMLIAAALAEALLIKTRRSAFGVAARYCLWVGVLAAAVAVVTGWFFGGMQWSDGDWIMTAHRWMGTATAVWSVLVLVLCELSLRRNSLTLRVTYRSTLLLGAGLVSFTGFLGGCLIYGIDHYAW